MAKDSDTDSNGDNSVDNKSNYVGNKLKSELKSKPESDSSADTRITEPTGNDTQPTPSRRRLKAAPQSLREQSEIANAKAGKAGRRGIVRTILGAPFRLIARLLRPVFRYLNKYKFFRIIGYILVPPYFRSAWRELRLVVWPNFRQTRDLTFAVLVFSIIFGVFVAIVDYGLDKVFRKVFLQ